MSARYLLLIFVLPGCSGPADENCLLHPVELELVRVQHPSACEVADGHVTAKLTLNEGEILYRLNELESTDGVFGHLPAGEYELIAHTSAGCADTVRFVLQTEPTRLRWNELKPLFTTRCAKAGCHDGTGRGDFSRYLDVLEYLPGIRHRVYTRSMPQDNRLEDEQVREIICWIDAGAKE